MFAQRLGVSYDTLIHGLEGPHCNYRTIFKIASGFKIQHWSPPNLKTLSPRNELAKVRGCFSSLFLVLCYPFSCINDKGCTAHLHFTHPDHSGDRKREEEGKGSRGFSPPAETGGTGYWVRKHESSGCRSQPGVHY